MDLIDKLNENVKNTNSCISYISGVIGRLLMVLKSKGILTDADIDFIQDSDDEEA